MNLEEFKEIVFKEINTISRKDFDFVYNQFIIKQSFIDDEETRNELRDMISSEVLNFYSNDKELPFDDKDFIRTNIIRDYNRITDIPKDYFDYFDIRDIERDTRAIQTRANLFFQTYKDGVSHMPYKGKGDGGTLLLERKISPILGTTKTPLFLKKPIYTLKKPSGVHKGEGISIDFSISTKARNSLFVIGKLYRSTNWTTENRIQNNKLTLYTTSIDVIKKGLSIESPELAKDTKIEKIVSKTSNEVVIELSKPYTYDEEKESDPILFTIKREKERTKISYNFKFKANESLEVVTSDRFNDKSNGRFNTFGIYFIDVFYGEVIDGVQLVNTQPNTEISVGGSFEPNFGSVYRMCIHCQTSDPKNIEIEFSEFSAKEEFISPDFDDEKIVLETEKEMEEFKETIIPSNFSEPTFEETMAKGAWADWKRKNQNKINIGGGVWKTINLGKIIGTGNLISAMSTLQKIRSNLRRFLKALEEVKAIANVLSELEQLVSSPFAALTRMLVKEAMMFLDDAKSSGLYFLDLQEIGSTTPFVPFSIQRVLGSDTEDDYKRKLLRRGSLVNKEEAEISSRRITDNISEDRKNEFIRGANPNFFRNQETFKEVVGDEEYIIKVEYNYWKPLTYEEFIGQIADAFIDENDYPDNFVVEGRTTRRDDAIFFTDRTSLAGNRRSLVTQGKFEPRPLTFRSGRPRWGRGTDATVTLVVFAAPNFELALNLLKRFEMVFGQATQEQNRRTDNFNDLVNDHWNSILKDFQTSEKFSLSELVQRTNEFNKTYAPSAGGNAPDFYGVNLYTIMPAFFDFLQAFVRKMLDFSYNLSDTISAIIQRFIDEIEDMINEIVAIVELIDQLIEFLQTIALTNVSVLTIKTSNGVEDIREQLLNTTPLLSAQVPELTELSENEISPPMWYGGFLLAYGGLTRPDAYSEALSAQFENQKADWNSEKNEMWDNGVVKKFSALQKLFKT